MGKLIILGIDAVEYEYVIKHKFGPLLLKRYGKVYIPHELWLNGVPYTPLVWTAYLTGKNPKDIGVYHIYEMPTWVRVLQKIIKRTPLKLIKGKRRLLKRLGIHVMKPYKIKEDTLLDDVKHSIGLNVPGISLDHRFYKILELIDKGKFVSASRLTYRLAKDIFTTTKNVIVEERARTSPTLVFSYVNVLDIVGHLYWVKEPYEVLRAYKFVARHVNDIMSIARNHGYDIVIISDHGMKGSSDGVTGTHTEYGFWSSTIENFSISSPYEFRRKVLEVVLE